MKCVLAITLYQMQFSINSIRRRVRVRGVTIDTLLFYNICAIYHDFGYGTAIFMAIFNFAIMVMITVIYYTFDFDFFLEAPASLDLGLSKLSYSVCHRGFRQVC